MSSETKNQHSKAFRILSLPRELRDHIYRELLLADKAPAKETFKFALEPAILRVKKQMYKECSRILYEENTWVLITVNWRNIANLLPNPNHVYVSHSSAGHLGALIRKPALQVDLRHQCIETQSAQESILFIAHRVFCDIRYLTGGHNPKQIDFNVQFDPRISRKPKVREDLLFKLHDIRGVGKTVVTGIETVSIANELATLMMTPMKSVYELSERADAYKKRGDQCFALGNSEDAKLFYCEGISYLDWARRHVDLTELSLTGMENHSWSKLKWLIFDMTELYIDSTFCDIKHGDRDTALDMLDQVIASLPGFHRANAHYYCGFGLLQRSKDGEALKAFTKALKVRPGHAGALEEVKMIKARTK